MLRKNSIENVQLWFIVISVVYISASPLLYNTLQPIILLVCAFLLLINCRYDKHLGSRVIAVFAFFVFLISFLFDFQALGNYGINTLAFFVYLSGFYLGYLVAINLEFSEFMHRYEKLVRYLCIISLVLFFSVLLNSSLLDYFFGYSYYDTKHKTLVLYNHVASLRNSGFAREPGVFQFFVAVAFWWRIKSRSKFDFSYFVYGATLLTTGSTAGLISLGALSFLLLGKKSVWIFVPLIFLYWEQAYDAVLYHLEYKLWGSLAFEKRLEPLYNAFRFFCNHPFGIGSINLTHLLKAGYDIAAWDSIGQTAVRFGVQGLLLFLTVLLITARVSFTLFVIFLITFSSQNIWLAPFVSTLVFYFSKNMGHIQEAVLKKS